MLHLYNTLNNKKEPFEPITPGQVRMYNCGPTVYNYAHIGNLRPYVFADTLRRALEHHDYDVTQVINITDVGHLTDDEDQGEDKVESQARREHRTADEITAYYTDAFFRDLAMLNITTDGTTFPRATNHIDEQIELIRSLEQKGYTYTTSDGVYFDTSRFAEYGKLGQLDTSGIEEGARVAANTEKRNPTDFALWKFSPADQQRQQEWESPWGTGYPGWHIECSAMSMKYLGETFDIHTGGVDHIPVHHNNEVAQSECATGTAFARYWLHNEFVDMSGFKMAKSEGNVLTLDTLHEEGIHPLAYRYWLLTAHYRTPISFTFEAVRGAQQALRRLASRIAQLPDGGEERADVMEEVEAALDDDLDTPRMIALMWEKLSDKSVLADADKKATAQRIMTLLGIDAYQVRQESITHDQLPQDIQEMMSERESARTEKDYQRADAIRDTLIEHGYSIEDTPDGPRIYEIG